MKVLVACKRGNISERNKWGHCLCIDCKKHRYETQLKRIKSTGYSKKWQQENKDKVKSYNQKWISNNIDKRREVVQSWRKRNPDKVKLMNKKGGSKWSKNNKAKRNAIDMKRKASMINRTPIWADLEKIKQFYIEAQRLSNETGVPHEVDHIHPLQGKLSSGLHVHTNLQILTRSMNRSKNNKEDHICVS